MSDPVDGRWRATGFNGRWERRCYQRGELTNAHGEPVPTNAVVRETWEGPGKPPADRRVEQVPRAGLLTRFGPFTAVATADHLCVWGRYTVEASLDEMIELARVIQEILNVGRSRREDE